MRLHQRFPRPRSIAALVLSVGVGGVASLALVTAASAHANIVSGIAACQSNGTYTVTWTVANDFNLVDNVLEVSHTGGGSIAGLPSGIAASARQPYNTARVTQTGVPGTATAASLTVKGTWSDKFTRQDVGALRLGGNCTDNLGTTDAVAPTFTNASCSSAMGSYTIPSSTIADYLVAIGNGAPVAAPAGTVSEAVGTLIKITAYARPGKTLTGTMAWSATISGAGSCGGGGSSSPPPPPPPPGVSSITVTPVAPTLTQGVCTSGKESAAFYMIPGITGVTYLNGTTGAPAGKYTVAYGSMTTITAAALTGYTFSAGATTSWTLTAKKAATCAAPPAAVLGVTFTQPPSKTPPVAVLPFTGQPILQTSLVAFALLLTGGLLIGSSRRPKMGNPARRMGEHSGGH